MRASSTMKNSASVNVGKNSLPTEYTPIDLYRECHSLLGECTSDTNKTHTLCCLNPILSIFIDE